MITEKFWQFFPVGVLIEENGAQVWHAATFFYESMWNLMVFAVLWLSRKQMKRRGDTFLWYMVLYGCGRFMIEQLRTDSLYLLGMRVSQMVGLVSCVASSGGCLWCGCTARRRGSCFLPIWRCACWRLRARLLASGLWGVLITIVLYVCTAGGLLLYAPRNRVALLFTGADLLVYLGLWIFGGQWLWQSPYFLYAGLSVAVYIMMVYRAIAKEAPDAGNGA